MTEPRQSEPAKTGDSLIREVSLGERLMERFMISWLEKTSAEDIAGLWRTLKDSAKVARDHTLWVRSGSGITLRVDFRGGAIVSITVNGFALIFTGGTMST